MTKEEKLYDRLGELIYVVAISDGIIQSEETDALEKLLQNHEKVDEIKWSFNYEVNKKSKVEDIYKKVISACQNYGSSPIYLEFINAMKTIANAVKGTDSNEQSIIDSFSFDLIERFKKDIENFKWT